MAPEEEFLALRDIFYADLGGECAPRFYLRLLRCDNCNLRASAFSPFFFSYSLSGNSCKFANGPGPKTNFK